MATIKVALLNFLDRFWYKLSFGKPEMSLARGLNLGLPPEIFSGTTSKKLAGFKNRLAGFKNRVNIYSIFYFSLFWELLNQTVPCRATRICTGNLTDPIRKCYLITPWPDKSFPLCHCFNTFCASQNSFTRS